jgi:hypothetical protein
VCCVCCVCCVCVACVVCIVCVVCVVCVYDIVLKKLLGQRCRGRCPGRCLGRCLTDNGTVVWTLSGVTPQNRSCSNRNCITSSKHTTSKIYWERTWAHWQNALAKRLFLVSSQKIQNTLVTEVAPCVGWMHPCGSRSRCLLQWVAVLTAFREGWFRESIFGTEWVYTSLAACAVLCCAVLCCAVLCCAVLCCAVLCCVVMCCDVLSTALCCI